MLVVAVEDDVVQDPAHGVFIISKNSYNTKPTVILHFSTLSTFWLKPTVLPMGVMPATDIFQSRIVSISADMGPELPIPYKRKQEEARTHLQSGRQEQRNH